MCSSSMMRAWPHLYIKTVFPDIGISIIKMWWLSDHLFFTVRLCLYIEAESKWANSGYYDPSVIYSRILNKISICLMNWVMMMGLCEPLVQYRADSRSTMVQVMVWCRKATSHYLRQCWPRYMSTYGITRPQWVIVFTHVLQGCFMGTGYGMMSSKCW